VKAVHEVDSKRHDHDTRQYAELNAQCPRPSGILEHNAFDDVRDVSHGQ